ncbi:hypothetical protein BT69DRAFT_1300012 [Atractiella rhizophila]|nr:hypothetical protein BT69DRAFT_1300012 [Atractiella rhizophila]
MRYGEVKYLSCKSLTPSGFEVEAIRHKRESRGMHALLCGGRGVVCLKGRMLRFVKGRNHKDEVKNEGIEKQDNDKASAFETKNDVFFSSGGRTRVQLKSAVFALLRHRFSSLNRLHPLLYPLSLLLRQRCHTRGKLSANPLYPNALLASSNLRVEVLVEGVYQDSFLSLGWLAISVALAALACLPTHA